MLEKLKDLFLKHMTELLGVLLTLLVGTIFWQVIPLLLSPLWTRLSTPALQRILGLSLLSVLALLAYVVFLHRKLKGKLRIRFGLYWDRNANPLCPACQSPLTGYTITDVGAAFLACVKCNQRIALRRDNGESLTLPDARELLLSR